MTQPTYFLSSLDSARFSAVRRCVVRRLVRFDTGKPAIVATIDPPVVGQDLGRSDDVTTVLLVARHAGHPVDPIESFPCFVHIAIADDTGSLETPVRADRLRTIGWGELYRTAEDAREHRFDDRRGPHEGGPAMDSDAEVPASHAIRAALPLGVNAVATSGPVLTLTGSHWSLTVWCPFRVTGLDFHAETDDLEEQAQSLVGHQVRRFSTTPSGPVFGFGDGVDLVLYEGDDAEPWVLKIPGLILTEGMRSPHW